MNKELEEAIKFLKLHSEFNNNIENSCFIKITRESFLKHKQAIETVLQALDNSISKEEYNKIKEENEALKFEKRSRTIGKYGEIEVHDLIKQTLSKDFISKEVIGEKITKLERELKEIEKLQFNDYYEYIQTSTQTKIICLQSIITKYKELLEGK